MKTKNEIVANWLPRYTNTPLAEFGQYILLVNFEDYPRMFSDWYNVPIRGLDKPMPNVAAEGSTLINFGMGSANAATVMDLLSAIHPKARAAWLSGDWQNLVSARSSLPLAAI